MIVEKAAYGDFRDRLANAVTALPVEDPAAEGTLVGPVIDDGARSAALAAVGASGGRVITGGKALDAPGYYLAPTLVELGSPVGPLASEEVFAPVAAVIAADSAVQAVEIANGVRFGLVAAVFTSDLSRALRLSSYGPREQGLAARAFYTESRTVLITPDLASAIGAADRPWTVGLNCEGRRWSYQIHRS